MMATKTLPAWRTKLQASLQRHEGVPFSKFFQLATIKPDGRPSNRTVVFRGFLEGTNDIQLVSDIRYNKVAEAARNPAAEVAWYFTDSREQYRLSGLLTMVGPDHENQALQDARAAVWRGMSDKARAQYLWPAPGAPKTGKEEMPQQPPPAADQPPLPTFCLSVLSVKEVDYYETNGQTRYKYSLDGSGDSWQELELNA
ncbi:hypothetical protein DUNSADRAFT_8039 [Dunaliella salina]|uniref:Pyridoxamine 5'-phosphate oxidase Alr4036 family FMN-binding domain-containing protein n=1 Tax=Dunaliella salina TaxID=3046 RepID=A0ABQ7GKA0_DUNSA|nr:hypothetical protein DUNSADRAFT_8039 [Dunaliella salina]|eukprot:KAF5835036.1 hypothetical protein DUNSADRAFT_8039 [Dunaliella salina]